MEITGNIDILCVKMWNFDVLQTVVQVGVPQGFKKGETYPVVSLDTVT